MIEYPRLREHAYRAERKYGGQFSSAVVDQDGQSACTHQDTYHGWENKARPRHMPWRFPTRGWRRDERMRVTICHRRLRAAFGSIFAAHTWRVLSMSELHSLRLSRNIRAPYQRARPALSGASDFTSAPSC